MFLRVSVLRSSAVVYLDYRQTIEKKKIQLFVYNLIIYNSCSIATCRNFPNMIILKNYTKLGEPQKRSFFSGPATKAFSPPPRLGLVAIGIVFLTLKKKSLVAHPFSHYTLSKVSKTTSPQKLFANNCVTLYITRSSIENKKNIFI